MTHHGFITRVTPERGFAFVGIVGQPADIFAHETSFTGFDSFDERLLGHRVTCEIRNTKKGLEAFAVRPATN